ncbi:MAG: hypothetical protein LBC29_01155 [Propionibacteriaceae bacterium]|nr:hypothetical protein [Propionibacteriaceae bacterium]
MQQPRPSPKPNGRKLKPGELVSVVIRAELLSWLITACVFGAQSIFVVAVTNLSEDSFTWLRVEGWYSQWMMKPLLFREHLNVNVVWTVFVFGMLNQSGLFIYGVVRPICDVMEAKYRLYGAPSKLRSHWGRWMALGVIVLLFINPGAMLDGVDFPNDLGLDWLVFGTSIWALGGTWDVLTDYRNLAGQFPDKPFVKAPLFSPIAAQPMPQAAALPYRRSALPPRYL